MRMVIYLYYDIQVRDGCEVVELESKGNLVKVVTEMGERII